MYRILWHDCGTENLSLRSYPTVCEAIEAAARIQSAHQQRDPAWYDIVFAENGRIVPDWFRQMEIELGSTVN